VLDLQTGEVTVWETDYPEIFPSWHPDGTAILYHANRSGDVQIYERTLRSSQPTRVSIGQGPNLVAHMSADTTQLVFASERDGNREIYLLQIDDAGVTRLTTRAGRDGYPKFSPDGTSIAYHSKFNEEQTVVTVLDLDSDDRTQFSCSDISR